MRKEINQDISIWKKGNKSALIAAIVNTIISFVKGIAYYFTGNVAMMAETLHSLGDAANQFFVFIGSALSKKAPTEKYPNGFGRLVNLVLLVAVVIVGIMSYENVVQGIEHIRNPVPTKGIGISITVLGIGFLLEFYVLCKAALEIVHESNSKEKGLKIITQIFTNLKKAKPATKLVFMEDLVATSGGLIAIIGILLSYYLGWHQAEGVASILIGLMMFYVVARVFLDNARGVLGETDDELEEFISEKVIKHSEIQDIDTLYAMKEGEEFHIEMKLEIRPDLTIQEANQIKLEIERKIFELNGVSNVIIEFLVDDGHRKYISKSTE